MSGTTKFTSIAHLLISCTLPFPTIAQPLAGSFPESAATQPPFFQQACPPDFPMPDIWERPGAGPIDIPSFAPVWLKSSFGWNRPLMFGSVPAEIVSGRFQRLYPKKHMLLQEPPFRCETRQAIDELAKELGLPNESHMQDWAWEVANPLDVDKYVQHYLSLTDEDKKFALMEIIVQAVEDQEKTADFSKYWGVIEPILKANFSLHQSTVWYWSAFETDDLADCWLVAPFMREVWYSANGFFDKSAIS